MTHIPDPTMALFMALANAPDATGGPLSDADMAKYMASILQPKPKRGGPAFLREFEDVFLSNPFEPGLGSRQSTLLGELPLHVDAVRRALRQSDNNHGSPQLERLLVAVAYAYGKAGTDVGELQLDELVSLKKEAREKCSNIGKAAARVDELISKIGGVSAAINKVRAATWNACFGADLGSLVYLSQYIRSLNVLIVGETGSGKELVAAAIGGSSIVDPTHPRKKERPGPPPKRSEQRQQKSGPAYEARNSAGFSPHIIDSELFGHVKGAFTGALKNHIGDIERANGGVYFLDELEELPHSTQAKMLRTMETGRIHRVGEEVTDEMLVDVRYVGATNGTISLSTQPQHGTIRPDFYHRIAGRIVEIPPLRQRKEDIPELVRICLHELRQDLPGVVVHDSRILRQLEERDAMAYNWPGNVRELRSVVRNLALGLEPQLERTRWEEAQPDSKHSPEANPDPWDEMIKRIKSADVTTEQLKNWYRRHAVMVKGNARQASLAIHEKAATIRNALKAESQSGSKSHD